MTGWLVRVLSGTGYLEEMTVCAGCLDEDLIVHKRRAVPGSCAVCGAETQ